MEKILIFIKHHFSFIWKIIEEFNGIIFSWLYGTRMQATADKVFQEFQSPPYICRKLLREEAGELFNLINSQPEQDITYFNPHKFDYNSIKNQFTIRSFLMMGVFDNKKLVGYFFLRFFANKTCFVGRLIDKKSRGMGIGLIMNKIMYNIAWQMDFRCLSTISRKNSLVMKAHANNPLMLIIKELENDYLLVEFMKPDSEISTI